MPLKEVISTQIKHVVLLTKRMKRMSVMAYFFLLGDTLNTHAFVTHADRLLTNDGIYKCI